MSEEAPAVNAVNYREKIVLYLPHRRAKYAHAKHLSRRDSTLLAIQKAQKRVPDANRDDLRLYLVHALHELYRGGSASQQKSYVKIALAGNELAFTAQRKSEIDFVCKDGDSLLASLMARSVEIATVGKCTVSVHSQELAVTKQFVLHYDLDEMHRLTATAGSRVMVKLPLYSGRQSAQIANLRLPAAELRFLVEPRHDVCVLHSVQIACTVHADPHQVLYTHRAALVHNPGFDPAYRVPDVATDDEAGAKSLERSVTQALAAVFARCSSSRTP